MTVSEIIVGASQAGLAQQFTFQYRHPNGPSGITYGQVLVNSDVVGPGGSSACLIEWYSTGPNRLKLVLPSGDEGDFGRPGSISNSYCSVDTSNSSITPVSGANGGYDVSLAISFAGFQDFTLFGVTVETIMERIPHLVRQKAVGRLARRELAECLLQFRWVRLRTAATLVFPGKDTLHVMPTVLFKGIYLRQLPTQEPIPRGQIPLAMHGYSMPVSLF